MIFYHIERQRHIIYLIRSPCGGPRNSFNRKMPCYMVKDSNSKDEMVWREPHLYNDNPLYKKRQSSYYDGMNDIGGPVTNMI